MRQKNIKIAMIVAPIDFRDEEYFIPANIFLGEGFQLTAFSVKICQALGVYGGAIDVKKTIVELDPAEFDSVIFIGGAGAMAYLDNQESYQVAQETISAGKLLGAICIAPVILAKAGVLKDKKATVWSSSLDKSAVKILKEQGVDYLAKPVVVDGQIITADGPESARKFAEAVVRYF